MSRFYSISRFGFAFAACLLCASVAPATILSHVGDNDPLSEGWTANNISEAGNSGSIAAGPSWRIVDGNTSESAFYANEFTLAELPTDWVQTVQVRVASSTANNGVFSAVTDASRLFYFFYTPTAFYYGENTNITPTFLFNVDNTAFHTYKFTYDSGSEQIAISLDDVYQTSLARTDFYPITGASAFQYFGSPASGATSESYWGLVTLAQVPEPSSALLAVIGFAGLLRARKRRGYLNT